MIMGESVTDTSLVKQPLKFPMFCYFVFANFAIDGLIADVDISQRHVMPRKMTTHSR